MKQIQSLSQTISFLWDFEVDGLVSTLDNYLFPPNTKIKTVNYAVVEQIVAADVTKITVELSDTNNRTILDTDLDTIETKGDNGQFPNSEAGYQGTTQYGVKLTFTDAGGGNLSQGKILFTLELETYPLLFSIL